MSMAAVAIDSSVPDIEPGWDRYRPAAPQEIASLDQQGRVGRFERIFVKHLDAAYNLAYWLTRDARNAEDVVQEACLRAFRFQNSFRGEDGRTWLLAIVRNTFYTWLESNRAQSLNVPLDEDAHAAEYHDAAGFGDAGGLEKILQRRDAKRLVDGALARLPVEFREAIILRELEDMSYKEIAAVTGAPLGTVMSRIARARKLMLRELLRELPPNTRHG